VERVNVSNTVIVNRPYITNVYNNRGRDLTYRNRHVPGAVTTVSRTAFTSAGRVGDHRVRIDDRETGRWRTAAVPPQIQPARESRYGGSPRGHVRPPPRAVVDRTVVVNRSPPSSSERFTRRFANEVAATREPEPVPRPQGRDHSNRENDGRRSGGDFGAHDRPQRNDRPQREVTSSPKTPPSVGYADSQRAQVGQPRGDDRRNDPPPREQLERHERERQQDSQRQARDLQEQQRRQAEFQRRHDQQRETQQREYQQRERNQRQQEFERQNASRQAEQRERHSERQRNEPRNEQPRVQQQPRAERQQENRPTRVQQAQESRQQKRQDDSRPQKN
jgi:hypothetical protein